MTMKEYNVICFLLRGERLKFLKTLSDEERYDYALIAQTMNKLTEKLEDKEDEKHETVQL
jgi:hypothetical protein